MLNCCLKTYKFIFNIFNISSILQCEMAQAVEILPQWSEGPIYPALVNTMVADDLVM